MFIRAWLITFLVFVAMTFSACKKTNPAVIYNDALVGYKNSADSSFMRVSVKIDSLLKSERYDSVEFISKSGIDSLNQYLTQIKNLDVIPTGKGFYIAIVQYIESLQNTLESYSRYHCLSSDTITLGQVDSINLIVKDAEESVKKVSANLINMQKDFAEKSGIEFANKAKK